jgi:hypothetical protein
MPPAEPEYLTMRQLCQRLNINRSTVRRFGWHRFGVLVGPYWRFDWRQVIADLAARTARVGRPKATEPGRAPRSGQPLRTKPPASG